MFLFRKKTQASTEAPIAADTAAVQALDSFAALARVERVVCGEQWDSDHSLSRITGMALGGLRSSALFSNDRLNEQANALSNLSQKTLSLVIHVQDLGTGNNQTLRLPFFRFFAGDGQQSVDFALIARRLTELSLLPIMVVHAPAQGAVSVPSAATVASFLGGAEESISTPTPSQEFLFGPTRRRLPLWWDLDLPMTTGFSVPSSLRDRQWAARRTYFHDHLQTLLPQVLEEFAAHFGRHHEPAVFLQDDAPHWVVTTLDPPADLPRPAPLVKINFMTAQLHAKLSSRPLTFVDRNHSRALGTALELSGFSLVHYGPLDASIVQAALELNAQRPTDIAGAHFLFAAPRTPKEEIYNQWIQDQYPQLSQGAAELPATRSSSPLIAPPAVQHHPEGALPLADLHRFWAHNGKYLASGQSAKAVATPALATVALPAGSGKMLATSEQYVARRIVEPATLLRTLLDSLHRDNYEVELLRTLERALARALQRRLRSGASVALLLEESIEEVASTAGMQADALRAQGRNALAHLPSHCLLEDPFVRDGGIVVEDRSEEHRDFFVRLPNTPERFLRDSANILLDRDAWESFVRTEDTAAQSISHLFSAVASLQARKKSAQLLEQAQGLLERLKVHNRQRLSVSLSDELGAALAQMKSNDLTLAELAQKLDREQAPVDRQWLAHAHGLQQDLERLCALWAVGVQGRGRASHGIISQNSAGVYPWSPVVVPWTQNGSGEGIEIALGLWEAQMQVLCRDFVVLRKAALELEHRYNPRLHNTEFAALDWRQLSPAELALCPPLVVTGSDLDFYRRSNSLGALFRTGAPVKVLVHDTLQAHPGAPLQHLAIHDIFVFQGNPADQAHLLEGLAAAIASPRPALIQVLSPTATDWQSFAQEALTSGVYPCYTGIHTEAGQCIQLHPAALVSADVALDVAWVQWVRRDPILQSALIPMPLGGGTPLAEWLALDGDDRAQTVPTLARTDGQSGQLRVSAKLIEGIVEWRRTRSVLRQLLGPKPDAAAELREEIRQELVVEVARQLQEMAREGSLQ